MGEGYMGNNDIIALLFSELLDDYFSRPWWNDGRFEDGSVTYQHIKKIAQFVKPRFCHLNKEVRMSSMVPELPTPGLKAMFLSCFEGLQGEVEEFAAKTGDDFTETIGFLCRRGVEIQCRGLAYLPECDRALRVKKFEELLSRPLDRGNLD